MDCSETFDIQCLTGSGRERFTFRPGSGFSAPIAALPAACKKKTFWKSVVTRQI